MAVRKADSPSKLSHINARGRAKMVDVSEKDDTPREATAGGRMRSERIETPRRASMFQRCESDPPAEAPRNADTSRR